MVVLLKVVMMMVREDLEEATLVVMQESMVVTLVELVLHNLVVLHLDKVGM